MKTYDKASWHIDGGENILGVITRFKIIFEFLSEKKMLSNDGIETMDYGMDSSVALNSTMVTVEGKNFLDANYDVMLKQNPKELTQNLQIAYAKFVNED